ncbi:glycosyltransferase family 2 protein [Taurinivorans muris]|uniref:Glycosyltransferase family 2 protein n=1 Tax=Taurinivorans muris TaxID=2787751 RepID=A0ABY5XYZ5_9BACT|nr:glycosyltransferase family 2 protein [Desulfovibrionaceae bacterium LT0009]
MHEEALISIIAPMYNEEAAIDIFFAEMRKFLAECPYQYEIVCVNDGSKDNTLDILKKYAEEDNRIKVVSFSRNFGKERALYAGLKYSSGDAVIPIDVDLQNPPMTIKTFLAKWEEGYDIVYGVRENRKNEGRLRRFLSKKFYEFYNLISEQKAPYNAADFRLMDRKVVNAVLRIREKHLFMKGIFNWVGYKSCPVLYNHADRAAGNSKFNFWKLWNLALDGITGSSTLPLRVWTYLGGGIAFVSFVIALFFLIKTILWGDPVQGFPTLVILLLFFGGIQLIALGIMGEYIGRIMIEVKNRPLYIVDELINIDE